MRQTLMDLRGTPAFADALAERERALGLVATTPVTEPPAMPDATTPDATPASDVAPLVATLTDRFGNRLLDAPGRLGQHRVVSARGWDNGRIVRVCGETATTKHLLWWQYEAGERRLVCRLCWPGEAPRDTKGTASGTGEHQHMYIADCPSCKLLPVTNILGQVRTVARHASGMARSSHATAASL